MRSLNRDVLPYLAVSRALPNPSFKPTPLARPSQVVLPRGVDHAGDVHSVCTCRLGRGAVLRTGIIPELSGQWIHCATAGETRPVWRWRLLLLAQRATDWIPAFKFRAWARGLNLHSSRRRRRGSTKASATHGRFWRTSTGSPGRMRGTSRSSSAWAIEPWKSSS
jgi:hypothetical protein